jgi:HemK-like putative methylase
VLELLVRGGRDLAHAAAMTVPQVWEGRRDLHPAVRDFYRYHAALLEPWDGPAGLVFTDGLRVAAALDRNGLRPLRYLVCEDGWVIASSEVGAVRTAGHGQVRRAGVAGHHGTGAGALALALKHERPQARVVAVEASAAALVVAKRNAIKHGLEIEFRHGRWLEPLAGERFDLIVANPPYVAEGDPHLCELGFEPHGALVSGADGLDAIREIAREAPRHLTPGGWLLLEHGMGQERAVRALLSQADLEELESCPDLARIPRVAGGKVK